MSSPIFILTALDGQQKLLPSIEFYFTHSIFHRHDMMQQGYGMQPNAYGNGMIMPNAPGQFGGMGGMDGGYGVPMGQPNPYGPPGYGTY